MDDENNSKPDLLGTFIKWGPRVAVAAGAIAAMTYTANEARKETCYPQSPDENEFMKSLSKTEMSRRKGPPEGSLLSFMIRCLSDGTMDSNTWRDKHGFAPIHLACQSGKIAIVQAILPFCPDLDLKTSCGKTPLDIVRIAKEEPGPASRLMSFEVIEYILKAVGDEETCLKKVPPPWPSTVTHPDYQIYKIADQSLISFNPDPREYKVKGARILCLDGGGTRGFIPMEFLEHIENSVMVASRDLTIKYCFDWIAGTSTGGIIALYLALGNTVRDCRKLYFELKDKVFAGSKPYNSKAFEALLKEKFGEETRMRDITGVKCVITATTGTAQHLHRVLFTNCPGSQTADEFIWKVARCTSAAPYFFDPYLDPATGRYFYDGGLTANNPTQAVLTEVNRVERSKLASGIVVSIGTGRAPPEEHLNLTITKAPLTMANFVRTLLKTLIHQVAFSFALEILEKVSKSDGEVVEDAMTTCSQANCSYYRLTPTLSHAVVLDETDNEKLLNMICQTKAYINMFKADIHEICFRLLSVLEDKASSGSCSIV